VSEDNGASSVGSPIAFQVLMLDNAYVSGTELPVDGGIALS